MQIGLCLLNPKQHDRAQLRQIADVQFANVLDSTFARAPQKREHGTMLLSMGKFNRDGPASPKDNKSLISKLTV